MARLRRLGIPWLLLILVASVACGGGAPASQPAAAPPPASPAAAPPAAPATASPAAPAGAAPSPAAAQAPAAPATASGGEVIHAMAQEPQMLDITVGSSRYDRQVTIHLYDQLLFMQADGTLEPWLAERWELASDGRSVSLTLRDGVKFHDGTTFNAQAVKANFDRAVAPETKSQQANGLLGSYERTEVVDGRNLKVHFKEPYPDILMNLAHPTLGIQSPAAVEKHGEDYGRNPVGTGPFKFETWEARTRIVLVRNPDYNWAPKSAKHQGPPQIERIVYRMIPEDAARVAALEKGEVTVAMRIAPQNVAQIQSNQRLEIVSAVLPGTGVILVLNGSKPPTDDIAVRRALAHLADIQQLSRIGYFGQWEPHKGSVLSAPNWAFKDLSSMYPYNVQKANELLDAAGWRRGPDGVRVKDGVRAKLQYIGFPSSETTRVMEFFGAQMKEAGMELEIVQLEGPAIQKARQEGRHNMAHLTFIFPEPGFLKTLFHSTNAGTGWNFTHVKDAKLDSLLEAGEREVDTTKRKQIYEEFQTHMLEQALVIPTVYQHQVMAIDKRLRGAVLYPVHGEYLWLYAASLQR